MTGGEELVQATVEFIENLLPLVPVAVLIGIMFYVIRWSKQWVRWKMTQIRKDILTDDSR